MYTKENQNTSYITAGSVGYIRNILKETIKLARGIKIFRAQHSSHILPNSSVQVFVEAKTLLFSFRVAFDLFRLQAPPSSILKGYLRNCFK